MGFHTLAPNSEVFTIGTDTSPATVYLATVTGPTTSAPFFEGTFALTSASWALITGGFPIDATVPADFIVYNEQNLRPPDQR